MNPLFIYLENASKNTAPKIDMFNSKEERAQLMPFSITLFHFTDMDRLMMRLIYTMTLS